MSDKIVLYGFDVSPPVRAVLLTLRALNLEFTHVPIDTYKGEHKNEDYLKKNPSHTIPLLEENGKYIADSHAIIAYLVGKYGKDDKLYPKDIYQRAIVDQRLHLENGVLFQTVKQNVGPLIRGNLTQEQKVDALKALREVYDLLELYLGQSKYIAGDNLTIGDFSVVSTLSSMDIFSPVVAEKWPNLATWFRELQKLPYYEEANGSGISKIKAMVKSTK